MLSVARVPPPNANQAEEARLQLEEKLERCNRLKRMDEYQREQQGIRVEQEKLR